MAAGSFPFPEFHSYPPYFTVQPVQETREKQLALWSDLALQYCQHTKTCILDVDEQDDELFSNPRINRKLSVEGRRLVLQRLVDAGRAEWMEKAQRRCLVLWFTLQQWAEKIWNVAQTYGLSVVTLDELSTGDEVTGTDIEGVHTEILRRALQLLARDGKVTFFSTSAGEGVKFVL